MSAPWIIYEDMWLSGQGTWHSVAHFISFALTQATKPPGGAQVLFQTIPFAQNAVLFLQNKITKSTTYQQSQGFSVSKLAGKVSTWTQAQSTKFVKAVGKFFTSTQGQSFAYNRALAKIISVGQSGSYLAQKASAHSFSTVQSSLLSLARFSQKFTTSTQASFLTEGRSVGKFSAFSQSQGFAFSRIYAKIITIGQSGIFIARKDVAHTLPLIAQGGGAAFAKAAAKAISLSQTSNTVLARAVAKFISAGQTSSFSLSRFAGKNISFTQSSPLALLKVIAKGNSWLQSDSFSYVNSTSIFRLFTNTQSVIVSAQIVKLVILTFTQGATLLFSNATGKFTTSSQIGSFSFNNAIQGFRAFAQDSSLSLLKAIATSNVFSQAQLFIIHIPINRVLSLLFPQAQSYFSNNSTIRLIAIAQSQIYSSIRTINKFILVVQTAVNSLNNLVTKSLAVFQLSNYSNNQTITKFNQFTEAVTSSLRRDTGRSLLITQAGPIHLQSVINNSVFIVQLSALMTNSAVSKVQSFIQTVTVRFSRNFFSRIAVTANTILSITRQSNHFLAAINPTSFAFGQRNLTKAVVWLQSTPLSLRKDYHRFAPILFTVPQAATFIKQYTPQPFILTIPVLNAYKFNVIHFLKLISQISVTASIRKTMQMLFKNKIGFTVIFARPKTHFLNFVAVITQKASNVLDARPWQDQKIYALEQWYTMGVVDGQMGNDPRSDLHFYEQRFQGLYMQGWHDGDHFRRMRSQV